MAKKLTNYSEQRVLIDLDEFCLQHGYRPWVKVRVADVLPVDESLFSSALVAFSLKSHFDFVISDSNMNPQFAVEFDGPLHKCPTQKVRDSMKDEICKQLSFPILRINDNHTIKKYNKRSLLRWIVSAWELQNSFYEAQKGGLIHISEDFYPFFLRQSGRDIEEAYPYWISLRQRLNIKAMYNSGKIPSSASCGYQFLDESDNYHGIEWIDVGANEVLCVESAMRHQNFPLYFGDLFEEIIFIILCAKLSDYNNNHCKPSKPEDVARRINYLKEKYRVAGAHFSGTCVRHSHFFSKT